MIQKTRIPALECTCEAILVKGERAGLVCGHRWYSISRKLPEACPNRDCRSREWNGVKTRVVKPKTKIELPRPVKIREVEDDEF